MVMRSAAGTTGRPGMSIISPAIATTNPAPLLTTTSRILKGKPSGRPYSAGLSEREYCVLAIITGKF